MKWPHYVYLFGLKDNGKVLNFTKVGVANAIYNRMNSLSTGNPFEVYCEGFIGFEDRKEANAMELAIKKHLKIVQVVREWFNGSPSDIYHSIVPSIVPADRFEKWNDGRAIRPQKKYRFRFAVP